MPCDWFGCKCFKWNVGLTPPVDSYLPPQAPTICQVFWLTAFLLWIEHLLSISMVITSSVEDKTAPPSRMVQSETWIPSSLLRKNKSQYKHTFAQLHHLKNCRRFLSSCTSGTSWLASDQRPAATVMALPFILVGVVEYATLWGPQGALYHQKKEIFGRWGHFVWSSTSAVGWGLGLGLWG